MSIFSPARTLELQAWIEEKEADIAENPRCLYGIGVSLDEARAILTMESENRRLTLLIEDARKTVARVIIAYGQQLELTETP